MAVGVASKFLLGLYVYKESQLHHADYIPSTFEVIVYTSFSLTALLLSSLYHATKEFPRKYFPEVMDAQSAETFILPRIFAKWPWVRNLSDHYEVCEVESTDWIRSFHPFKGEGLKAYQECKFCLLASLAYSQRKEKIIIRLGCDLLHIFFVVDEYIDVADGDEAGAIFEEIKDVFKNPDSIDAPSDHLLTRMIRDFWHRARTLVPKDAPCLDHFIEGWNEFATCMTQEADDRTKCRYRTFEDYKRIRRGTVATYPCFALIEFGLNIPEEMYQHPVLCSLREKATVLLFISNDMYSVGMEKSRGLEVHNAVELVMRERKISLQEAMDWLGEYCEQLEQEFLRDLATLPSWGEDIDARVSVYVNGLAQWVRGQDDWVFETPRYFGSHAASVKDTRIAPLSLPKQGYVDLS